MDLLLDFAVPLLYRYSLCRYQSDKIPATVLEYSKVTEGAQQQ